MPTKAIIRPTRARRQHDMVERVEGRELIDSNGVVATPFRVTDTLQLMARRGTISAEMHAAGIRFRDAFAVAQLDALRAADMARAGGRGWSDIAIGGQVERARGEVWRMLQAVGGLASPAGSVLWHVLGLGQSLTQWAGTQGWCGRRISREAAGGILVAALGAMAGK